jgi:hypothetical protein
MSTFWVQNFDHFPLKVWKLVENLEIFDPNLGENFRQKSTFLAIFEIARGGVGDFDFCEKSRFFSTKIDDFT